MNASKLFTGDPVLWKKPGKRYAVPCTVVSVNVTTNQATVMETNGGKWRAVKADELTAAPRPKPLPGTQRAKRAKRVVNSM